jgi:hypothetical protein
MNDAAVATTAEATATRASLTRPDLTGSGRLVAVTGCTPWLGAR